MIDVLQHGVIADGTTMNTVALQPLIDRCSQNGGGSLAFPAGCYLTGGLELRDDIHLHLEAGATLLGSTSLADYRHYPHLLAADPENEWELIPCWTQRE